MKTKILLVAVLLGLFTGVYAGAEEDDFTFSPVEGGVELDKYRGSAKNVVIPAADSVGRPVVRIGNYAFTGTSSISSVTIPDSVTSIGTGAFHQQYDLVDVNLGENMTVIEAVAFEKCHKLETIVFPKSLVTIGDRAFDRCPKLTRLDFPASLESIGELAFESCTSLSEVTFDFDSRLETVGDFAFSWCKSLERISLPITVTELGIGAFTACTALEDAYIFNTQISAIRAGTFLGCASLKEVAIPDTVTFIDDQAFADCLELKEIRWGQGIEVIGSYSFSACMSLARLEIPDSVTLIGEFAFAACGRLEQVFIGRGVEFIGNKAFINCTWLEEAIFLGNAPLAEDFGDEVFESAAADFSIYYFFINTGFTTPTWEGYPCTYRWYGANEYRLIVENGSGSGRYLDFETVTIAADPPPEGQYFDYWQVGGGNEIYVRDIYSETTTVTIKQTLEVTAIYSAAPQVIPTEAPYTISGVVSGNNVEGIEMQLYWQQLSGGSVATTSYTQTDASGHYEFKNVFQYVYGYTGIYYPHVHSDNSNDVVEDAQKIDLGTSHVSSYDFTSAVEDPEISTPPDHTCGTEYEYGWRTNGESLTLLKAPCGVANAVIPETAEFPAGSENFYPVVRIYKDAFSSCQSLTSVTIPEGVTAIDGSAFSDCRNLVSVTLPGTLEKIASSTFGRCYKLASVSIPEGVESIDSQVFWECESLVLVSLPGSLTSIGSSAFWGCISLASVSIPENVTEIKSSAFRGCTSLASVSIPAGVTLIDSGTFYQCTSLVTVTIPDGVTEITTDAFRWCSSLETLSIPDSVEMIGPRAFANCTGLTTVELGTGVGYLRDSCFRDCFALEDVVIKADIGIIEGLNSAYGFNASQIFSGTALKTVTLGAGTTVIPDSAFRDCRLLESVTISDGATEIGDYAFEDCTSLSLIDIPDSVETIGTWAFSGCSSLTSLDFPGSLTSIGASAFSRCSSLMSVDFPESLTSIGTYAFYSCSKLTSVVIPAGVTELSNSVFGYAYSLQKAEFMGNAPTTLGYGFFNGAADGFTVFCQNGSTGFTFPLWRDYPCVMLGEMFHLTVENGSGSGDYIYGTETPVVADVPVGQVLEYWTGDVDYLSDPLSADAVFTMPAQDCTITASLLSAFNVGGTVTNPEGVEIMLTITGKKSATLYLVDGAYVFDDIPDGVYLVEAYRPGYEIEPASIEVTVSGADVSGVDFAISILPGTAYEAWKSEFFTEDDLTNLLVSGASADPDHDGQDNLSEYISGMNPTNPASYFAITNHYPSSSFVLEWTSVTGRWYDVWWSASLTNAFLPLGDFIEHPQNSYTDTLHNAESKGFYKVKVQLK
jgi:hypothetical protein